MRTQDMAIMKALTCVAWADGQMEESESRVLEAILQSFEASAAEAAELRAFAAGKKSLTDIPKADLTEADCKVLIEHACALTYADGKQDASERAILEALCAHVGLPQADASALIAQASDRAKRFMAILSIAPLG